MSRKLLTSFSPSPIEEPTINLTPLIDVVFVILIMFILIAPLLELDRIELADHSIALVEEGVGSVQASSPITVHVHQDNTILFNHEQIPIHQLTEQFKKSKIQFPGAIPQIFHDRRAQFGTYQSVKNAAEEAGFPQIEIILKPA